MTGKVSLFTDVRSRAGAFTVLTTCPLGTEDGGNLWLSCAGQGRAGQGWRETGETRGDVSSAAQWTQGQVRSAGGTASLRNPRRRAGCHGYGSVSQESPMPRTRR